MSVTLMLAIGLGAAVMLVFVGLGWPRQASPLQARLNQFGTRIKTLEEMELETPFADRVLRPLVRGLARMVLRFAPQRNVEIIKHKLEMAGNPHDWAASDYLGIRGLAAVVCATIPFGLMVVAQSPISNVVLFTALGGALGFYLPVVWLGRKIRARQKEIQLALPDALDLLTIAVEAGLALDAAMAKVAEKSSNELATAFGRVISEVRMGKARRDALKDMADRAGVPDLTTFTTAVIQAEQLGVSLSKVLRIQSDQMRVKRRQRAEEEAHKAPVKMSVVLVLLLVPGLFIVILGPSVPRLCRQFNLSEICR